MTNHAGNRYFDLSTILALGLAAFLLISLPGGCWSDDEGDEDASDDVEAVSEPTSVPTMEIVDPEPGGIDTAEPPGEEGEEAEAEDGGEPAGESEESDGEGDTASDEGSYVVQEGDTLYAIAVELGVSMEDLMEANGIEDPNSLQVGQELQAP